MIGWVRPGEFTIVMTELGVKFPCSAWDCS
jgi:hypothetical protein